MLSDIEIAQQTEMRPIQQIAASLGVRDEELELYGHYKAKIDLSIHRSGWPTALPASSSW